MFAFLDLYIFGWLICCNLSCVWEMSSIKIHLLNFFNKVFKKNPPSVFTEEEWQVEMSVGNYWIFGEMLSCVFCYGTWLSALVSLSMCFLLGYPVWLVVICALSWPTLTFAVVKELKEI